MFVDEQNHRIRLLQYINGKSYAYSVMDGNKQEVSWYAKDYAIKGLMKQAQWKLDFMNNLALQQKFINIFNSYINQSRFKSVSLRDVNDIDQKTKKKVNKYITTIKSSFPNHDASNNSDSYQFDTFYRIPRLVVHLCILYYHDSFQKIIRDIYHTSVETKYGAIQKIRCLSNLELHFVTSPAQLIDTGIIPKIKELTQDMHHPKLQFEALWILLK